MLNKQTKVRQKRSVLVTLLLVFALVVAGCTGNNGNNDSNESTPSPSPEASESGNTQAESEPIEISWHGSFQLDALQPDSYVEKIIEETFNVKINFVTAKMDKLNLLAASNELPDVMRIADPKDVASLGGSGVLLELPLDTLQSKIPDVVASVNEVDSGLWGLSSIDGVNYAIPQYLPVVPWDNAMAWREDVLKAAGIASPPTTIAEYDSAFKSLKEKEMDILAQTNATAKNLYAFSGSDIQYAWNGFSWLFGAYGSMPGSWQVDSSGKVIRGEMLPGTKDALLKLNEWFEAGYIDPAFVTDKGEQWDSKFTQGTYAMFTRGMDGIVKKDPDNLQASNPNVIYTYTKAPAGPNGDSGIWAWGNRQNFIAFSAKLKDQPEKLDKILEILNAVAIDEELYKLTHWGEEGRSYKMENGIPIPIPPYDDDKTPEVNALGTGTLGPNGGVFGPFGTIEIVNKFTDPALVKASQDYYAGKPDVLYSSPLPSTASTEQRIIDKWNETFIKVVIGEAPISAYDDFVSWFSSNGGDQLTKEANELYDLSFRKK